MGSRYGDIDVSRHRFQGSYEEMKRIMENQLINLKSNEGVDTPRAKLVYDEVKLAFFRYNNFDKTLRCEPWGDHI
jgi:hypothetical protein